MPAHLDAVARALGGSRLARVLITHSHPDHVGGVPALLERWPVTDVRNSRPTPAGTARSSPRATRSSPQCTHPGTRPITSASSTKRPATCIAATSPGGAGPSSSPPARAATSRNTSHRCAGSASCAAGAAAARPRTDYRGRRADRRAPGASRRTGTTGAGGAGSGCETVDQIVDRIYSGLHLTVVRAAADSVLAHLIKLRDEGLAVETDGRWVRGP